MSDEILAHLVISPFYAKHEMGKRIVYRFGFAGAFGGLVAFEI